MTSEIDTGIAVCEGPLSYGLSALLTTAGLKVTRFCSFQEMCIWSKGKVELLILDVFAPAVTWEAWQVLREKYQGRILLVVPLVERVEVATTLMDLGRLAQQVQHLLKQMPAEVSVGELIIDLIARRVMVKGKSVRLAPAEYAFLAYLAHNQGRAVSFDELLEQVWSYPPGQGSDDQVRSCARRLRSRLGENARQPQYIVTVRSVGYRLRSREQWIQAVQASK
jgi:DNA-binding response OmpR family regulator